PSSREALLFVPHPSVNLQFHMKIHQRLVDTDGILREVTRPVPFTIPAPNLSNHLWYRPLQQNRPRNQGAEKGVPPNTSRWAVVRVAFGVKERNIPLRALKDERVNFVPQRVEFLLSVALA